MITSLIFHLVSAWFAFLLPSFATYKALSRRDIDAVQNLSMYWCTVGVLVGVEYTCEWLISWFPFYWELKTLFLLFLALPQTQGSTWVYQSYLEPFFRQNEHELDQGILSTQSTVITFAQAKFQAVWEALWGMVNGNAIDGRSGAGAHDQQRPGVPPGAAPSPYDAARQLFNNYAPGVLGSLVGRSYGTASTDPNSNTTPSLRPNASSSSSFSGGNSSPYQRTPSHTPRNEGDVPNFPQPRFH